MVSAPGRVNLIGEHIDYHGLPVLPMALRRSIRIQFQARADSRIRVTSGAYGHREFTWAPGLTPVARGDWENYLRAAAQAIAVCGLSVLVWQYRGSATGSKNHYRRRHGRPAAGWQAKACPTSSS